MGSILLLAAKQQMQAVKYSKTVNHPIIVRSAIPEHQSSPWSRSARPFDGSAWQ
jgi:hypothetical protein